MKLLIVWMFLFAPLLSTASELKNWNDLEPAIKYHTKFSVKFENGIELSADTPLVLTEIYAGQSPVMYFEFYNLYCKDPNVTAEMVLVNPEPEDLTDDKSVGVLLDKDCKVGVYVEPRHYYNRSLLY